MRRSPTVCCPHCGHYFAPTGDATPQELLRLRRLGRLTQRELAKRLNVTNTYLSKMERGHWPIPTDMGRRYRAALGMENEA